MRACVRACRCVCRRVCVRTCRASRSLSLPLLYSFRSRSFFPFLSRHKCLLSRQSRKVIIIIIVIPPKSRFCPHKCHARLRPSDCSSCPDLQPIRYASHVTCTTSNRIRRPALSKRLHSKSCESLGARRFQQSAFCGASGLHFTV